jgi:hypothetical protein
MGLVMDAPARAQHGQSTVWVVARRDAYQRSPGEAVDGRHSITLSRPIQTSKTCSALDKVTSFLSSLQ